MKKSAFIVLILLAPVLICAFAVSDRTISQYLTQAQGVMLNGNYKYAIDLYNTVLLMDPNNVDAMIGKGTACKMMGDDARGDLQYENAKKINPDVVLPDLWKYKERDRLRGDKDNAEIAKKYHEMFDKKPASQDLNISGVPLPTGQVEITGVGVTSAAKNLEQPKAAATTDDDKKKMLADKEWQVRGGNAKMLSLGGIKFVYPDMTTAMDGAGQGIDSGYLFRRKQHVFNLDPYAGYYYRNTGVPSLGLTDQNHALMVNSDYSLGDVNMPNDYFVSIVKPVFQNSFDLHNTSATINPPTLPQVLTNAGSQFGGSFMLGIKPVPYFGMSGEIGYEYLPYSEVINNGGPIPTMGSTNFTRIEWQAGGGFCLPTVFTQVDQLDLTASFGSYSPLGDPADLENDYLFKLPYSLLQGYTKTVTTQTQGFDINHLPYVLDQHSDIFNSTGYTLKTNLHYMFGNALHEFFAYFETPMNLQYTDQTKVTEKDPTGLITYSENDSPLTQVANANMFKFKTGLRDDFQYVSIGTKYEIDNSNYYLNTTNVPSIFLPPSNLEDGAMLLVPDFASMITNGMAQYSNAYKITAGINIKPIWAFTIPIEYEYDVTDIRFASQQVGTLYLDKIIRLGLELKPVPIFAVRGGISYETISNQSKAGMPGSAANPFYCITGYHFGAGFDLPIFELNAGGAYKKLFASPTVGATNDNYFVEGFLDINIYM